MIYRFFFATKGKNTNFAPCLTLNAFLGMSQQSLFEKLQIATERNFLIQGLPSSIEKQFIKLSYSKNVTPLLKLKKIDFALVFAISGSQLTSILKDIIPNLNPEGKLWVAYPKSTSKIVSDLSRDCNWDVLVNNHFVSVNEIELDNVWIAARFERTEAGRYATFVEPTLVEFAGVEFDKKLVVASAELEKMFNGGHKKAREVFQTLSASNQKEYVEWIDAAKRKDIRIRRLEATMEKLLAGKKTPLEK